jgi:hypothetical protein
MKRLSLDDFKMKSSNSEELEMLTGGILGACHTWTDKHGTWHKDEGKLPVLISGPQQ